MADDIEWITSEARLAELATDWADLIGPASTPFEEHAWFMAWWAAFGQGGDLRVCAAWRDDRLVAVLPLKRRGGGGLATLVNAHTPLLRPLSADRAALETVVGAALQEGDGDLEVCAIPRDDTSLEVLREHATRSRRRHHVEPAQISPIVETGGQFDAWRTATKPRWGAPLERFRRKMRRDHRTRMTLVESPTSLAHDLERGFAVEASGWKGARGTAILSAPETAAFYRHIARAFHERGELRLSAIELDGTLAAFDLTLLSRNRLYLLKTGFDETFRRLAPGLVMRLSIVERCFELGLDAHELLGDDSEWKRKFATTARAHASFRAFPRGALGTSRYGYRTIARPLLKRARAGIRSGGDGAESRR